MSHSSTIRWEEVKERLQNNEAALQESLSESPQRIRQVYRQRASQLAKSYTAIQSSGVPALIFRLGREKYAIKLADLIEVLPFTGCTPVPGSSPAFLGVIGLRGELRPVIDLGQVLFKTPANQSGFVLMLHRGGGLKVDDVDDLLDIRLEEFMRSGNGPYIQGVAPGPVLLLDVEGLLSDLFSVKES